MPFFLQRKKDVEHGLAHGNESFANFIDGQWITPYTPM
jgi:hypothetical protein